MMLNRHIRQEVCPFVQKFSVVAPEGDYAARESREAVWAREDVSAETSDDGTSFEDDDGFTEAVIPTTDRPALVDLMRMNEDEWDAYTRGSAMRRAGYAGLRRNVAIALGNWLTAGGREVLRHRGRPRRRQPFCRSARVRSRFL